MVRFSLGQLNILYNVVQGDLFLRMKDCYICFVSYNCLISSKFMKKIALVIFFRFDSYMNHGSEFYKSLTWKYILFALFVFP